MLARAFYKCHPLLSMRSCLACLCIALAVVCDVRGQGNPYLEALDQSQRATLERLPDLDPPSADVLSAHVPRRLPPVERLPDSVPKHEVDEDGGKGDTELPEHGTSSQLWWQPLLVRPFRQADEMKPLTVEQLVLDTLQHSLHVRALQEPVRGAAEQIIEAAAEFDARSFLESKFADTSDPVGNTLVTGGPNRLNVHDWQFEGGLRKRLLTGADIEVSQRLGFENSNSLFFLPPDQGSAQLVLSFSQPLLKGAGRVYNDSLIMLAELNTQREQDEYARQLQDYLLTVTDAYWQLYYQRGLLLQKQRHLERARQILTELEHRVSIDALQSQIVRARAAVASRQAELARAEASVRNVESRLRALTNAPDLALDRAPELIPVEAPLMEAIDVNVADAVQTALTHRPEVDEALQRVRAACVRRHMSENELLPALSFELEAYVSGLRGESDIGDAFARQWTDGAPSYTAGLVFERPWYNRAAQARWRRREAEFRKLTLDLHATMETLAAEAEIAVRDVKTAYQELQAKREAMTATVADVRYLYERWKLLPGDDRSASFLLEDILDAQDRLLEEESSVLRAQVEYATAIARLKRATGTLLNLQHVTMEPFVQPVPIGPVGGI